LNSAATLSASGITLPIVSVSDQQINEKGTILDEGEKLKLTRKAAILRPPL